MLHLSNTRFPRVLPWLCGFSALFLLLAGGWAAYTYAYLTTVPPGDIMFQQPLEYYLAQARTVGTWLFLPSVFLSAILIAFWVFLIRRKRSQKRSQTQEEMPQQDTLPSERQRNALAVAFPLVRMRLFRTFVIILSWIILLVGIVLAVAFAIESRSSTGAIPPDDILFGLAVGLLIFIPALFLFVALNAIGTLVAPRRRRSATD